MQFGPRTARERRLAGAAFAIGWTPCIGPTLGSDPDRRRHRGQATDGAVLLFSLLAGAGRCRSSPPGIWLSTALWRRPGRCAPHWEAVTRTSGAVLVFVRRAARHRAARRDQRPARPVRSARREGRLRGRQPAAVHQGCATSCARSSPSATTCWCTPGSTTTPSCRTCSSPSSSCDQPDHQIEDRLGQPLPRRPPGMMTGLEPVLADEAPDLVLTYGDTNSTLAGALVAAKSAPPPGSRRVRAALVRPSMPEEVNRVVADVSQRPALLPQPDRGREPRGRGHPPTASTWSAT